MEECLDRLPTVGVGTRSFFLELAAEAGVEMLVGVTAFFGARGVEGRALPVGVVRGGFLGVWTFSLSFAVDVGVLRDFLGCDGR